MHEAGKVEDQKIHPKYFFEKKPLDFKLSKSLIEERQEKIKRQEHEEKGFFFQS